MSTKYGITLTWNKGKKKLTFPVLPEKLEVAHDSKNSTVSIAELGDIIEIGTPSIETYTFSCFFPKNNFGGVVVNSLKKPMEYVEKLDKLLTNQTVVKFTVSGMKISKNCLITNFKYYEEGGDVGTIKYSITFKEYFKPKVRKIKKKSKSSKTSSSGSKKPLNYKVKKGDTLFLIAQKKMGDGSQWGKIWNLNKSTIKKVAKKKGKKATKNKPNLVPGTILKLPYIVGTTIIK